MSTEQTPQPRSRRGNYAKTAARRRAIIDAATAVFAESGYRGGSMKVIAERSGLSEAGLMHHFPNKHLLLEGVLEIGDDLDAHMRDYPPSSGIGLLQGIVSVVRHNAAIPGRQELINALVFEARSPEHPAYQYFQDRFRMISSHLTIAFERIAADGQLREDLTPNQASVLALAGILGLETAVTAEWSDFDHPTELRRMFGLLLKSGSLPD